MRAERGRWRRKGWAAALVAVAGILVALNIVAGRSPVKLGVLSALKPFLALLGAVDPVAPAEGGAGVPDPEIAALRAKNARLAYEVHRLRDLVACATDASCAEKRYPFLALPAQVLCRAGVPGLRRVVVVDRGARDGVAKGLGVVSGDRVVGRVTRVEEEICLVLLSSDPACKIRCTFLPGAGDDVPAPGVQLPLHEGLCEGDLEQEGWIRLRHLPRHAAVEAGSPVVTTGLSGVFPSGMSVGTATTVAEEPDGLFLDVRVMPATEGQPLRSVVILLPALGVSADPAGR